MKSKKDTSTLAELMQQLLKEIATFHRFRRGRYNTRFINADAPECNDMIPSNLDKEGVEIR